ncbi:MAG: abortive infection family protein [Thermodesulfobacteriota bacterium]|nr:abortive infection family protein [Thermodesulfobacteriota bacterium]
MTPREINKLVEDYIGTNSGYLNNFTYHKHDQFYPVYCGLDIDVSSYRTRGHTTRTAFIEILKDSPPRQQAKIIRGIFEMLPPPEEATDDESRNKIKTYNELLAVAARLEADGQVDTPVIEHTSEVVYEALKDAEILLNQSGPRNAVDRAHTALHGYLKKLCVDRGEALPDDPSLTQVFKVIREKFIEFKEAINHDVEARKVYGSLAGAIDGLNTIRNRGSLAHPNELLIDAPEAMLYINLTRAILAYIEAKINRS